MQWYHVMMGSIMPETCRGHLGNGGYVVHQVGFYYMYFVGKFVEGIPLYLWNWNKSLQFRRTQPLFLIQQWLHVSVWNERHQATITKHLSTVQYKIRLLYVHPYILQRLYNTNFV
jgi:hypothetical protein